MQKPIGVGAIGEKPSQKHVDFTATITTTTIKGVGIVVVKTAKNAPDNSLMVVVNSTAPQH